MISMPGAFTAAECFTAISASASAIKLFPCIVAGTTGLKALKEGLPLSVEVYAVGGVSATKLEDWRAAGAAGFGGGVALYKRGATVEKVAEATRRFIAAYDGETS